MNTVPGPADDLLALYLDALFGAEPAGGLIEVRWKLDSGRGMGREFIDCRRRADAAALVMRRGAVSDAYIGVAPRRRREGGRDAIDHVHVLWADCDGSEAVAALRCFKPWPAIVVRSGTGENAHAYWPLREPVGPDDAERANRRIAHALGADARSTDAARILRPPGTLNHKASPPAAVEVARLEVELFDLEDVAGQLEDPPSRRSARSPASSAVIDPSDPLATIAPPVYVAALTGREPGRDGKIVCPFHEDRTPSLHVYPDAERGWTCFGCDRGGSIIDFGAALYGLDARGRGYHEIRRRLAADLLGKAA